jgi:hypothetical protein
MKWRLIIIWAVACIALGVGGAVWYLNRPSVIAARNENYVLSATPSETAHLVSRSFVNHNHRYTMQFFSDGVVVGGDLAAKANQEAILARPGHTSTSFVVLASPVTDVNSAHRSDCGVRNASNVVFTVSLSGQTVSVCHDAAQAPYPIYTMDVRSTGTWEEVTFFDNALGDLTPHNDQIKTILGSLKID